MENEQAKFEGWAIVEMMGHQREIGYVTTESYGQAVLFRVDVPEFPEREYVLERPQWDASGNHFPIGAKVQRVALPARSRLISPAAIYALNPCSEHAAHKAIEASIVPRLILIEAPQDKQLPTGYPPDHGEDYEDDPAMDLEL